MRTGISFTASPTDRRRLDAVVRDHNTAQKHVWRATIILTQLIHNLIAKVWTIARKLSLSFSYRVASLRISFMVQKNRSTILRLR